MTESRQNYTHDWGDTRLSWLACGGHIISRCCKPTIKMGAVRLLARFGQNALYTSSDSAFASSQRAPQQRADKQITAADMLIHKLHKLRVAWCSHQPSPRATNKSSEKRLNYMAIFNSCIFYEPRRETIYSRLARRAWTSQSRTYIIYKYSEANTCIRVSSVRQAISSCRSVTKTCAISSKNSLG